jgi:hypothetical protein
LLSSPLAAAYLGVSEGTLRGLGAPPVRLGGRVLFDRLTLDALADRLASGAVTNQTGAVGDWTEALDADERAGR